MLKKNKYLKINKLNKFYKMTKCIKDYTVINSQPSTEALVKLVSAFFDTFGITNTIDDLFYYGVFCKPQNYANFEFDVKEEYDFDIPYNITNQQANEEEKIDYVKKLIKQILKKEISKPEWMKYVEMYSICNEYGQAPSTFLQIIPKQHQYEKLAQRLTEFLYSPNLTITMVKA